jgi:hypothetical protein
MYPLAFYDRDWIVAGRQLPIHENDRLGAIHAGGQARDRRWGLRTARLCCPG